MPISGQRKIALTIFELVSTDCETFVVKVISQQLREKTQQNARAREG